MTKSVTVNYAVASVAIATMVLSLFAFATPASAAMNSSSISITTTNRGSIDNNTMADARTGLNTALGSLGGRGGDGGDVESDGNNNNGGATSGNGGNGGNGGAGGLVSTGEAESEAGTENGLNLTDVDVQVPTDMNSASVGIDTDNDRDFPTQNHIANLTDARSRTGANTALGSEGGAADDAGDVEGGVGDFNNGGASSGMGGNGGAGGLGGTITTGRAEAVSGTVNLLNTILVRVRN